jgi:methionyl-tRNA formyltransferase
VNILFAGTPEFAARVFAALLSSPYAPLAVFTQPDRPAGRGQHAQMSAVKTLASRHQLPVHQPTQIDASTLDLITAYQPDLMIVVAYGLLLPPSLLAIPRFGCINLHASLLPRWRGAAPIQRAIAAGDTQTGITLMQMDKGLDTGAMLACRSLAITRQHNSQTLHDALAILSSQLLLDTLPLWPNTPPIPQPQPTEGVMYAHKLRSEEAALDWSLDAAVLERQLRAFYPWPGSHTWLSDGTRLKIGAVQLPSSDRQRLTSTDVIQQHHLPSPLVGEGQGERGIELNPPGTLIAASQAGLLVSTGGQIGSDRLLITHAQWPGGRMLPIKDLLNGHSKAFAIGERLITHNPAQTSSGTLSS